MIRQLLLEAPNYIKKACSTSEFEKGEYLIFQGVKDDNIYIIEQGEVEIVSFDEEGKQYSIWTQGEDSMFGEVELYNSDLPQFNVVALKNTRTLRIPKRVYIEWMNENPEVLKHTYVQLVDKLLSSSKRQVTFLSLPLRERVLQVLINKHKTNMLKHLTKKQLCIDVFAPVRSVNRVLTLMGDIVEYRDKKFTLIDKKVI